MQLMRLYEWGILLLISLWVLTAIGLVIIAMVIGSQSLLVHGKVLLGLGSK
jgi:hypothetical protein